MKLTRIIAAFLPAAILASCGTATPSTPTSKPSGNYTSKSNSLDSTKKTSTPATPPSTSQVTPASWSGPITVMPGVDPAWTLENISCPSTDVCYAVGSNGGTGSSEGVTLKTTNGGSTWIPGNVPPDTPFLSDISCPSTTVCYAVGFNGLFEPSDVITTTNGGATWTSQSVPSSVKGGLLSISCASSTSCIAVGGFSGMAGSATSAVGTTDGGATWNIVNLPAKTTPLENISCPSTTVCYAVGSASKASTSGEGYVNEVIATNNGGATWSYQSVPSSVKGTLMRISCPSTHACYAGWEGQAGISSIGIIATNNGGATWSSQSVPSGITVAFGGISCASTKECEAVGSYAGFKTPEQNYLIATTNGGATWVSQSIASSLTGGLGSISCSTTSFCIAVTITQGTRQDLIYSP
ncbi:MAG: WD40/YVTN/BNR-like repeat-containing protein [Ferrimicrobium sp.]